MVIINNDVFLFLFLAIQRNRTQPRVEHLMFPRKATQNCFRETHNTNL